MIGFIFGWAYGHVFEWLIHKYLLHSRWAKRSSGVFAFHFAEHHYEVRRNKFIDDAYFGLPIKANSAGKEALCLLLLLIAHLPIIYISAGFYLALFLSMAEYYYKHRKAHVNPEWARDNLPWHYDHHMSKNQDANFGVRSDWVDVFFGTREYTIIK
jgi:sterol desaturase/sphingolipid hydroxylase (fatty acid hydroxylase superfamily)